MNSFDETTTQSLTYETTERETNLRPWSNTARICSKFEWKPTHNPRGCRSIRGLAGGQSDVWSV